MRSGDGLTVLLSCGTPLVNLLEEFAHSASFDAHLPDVREHPDASCRLTLLGAVGKQVFLAAHHQADRNPSKTPPFLYGKPGRIEPLYEYPTLEVFRYMLVAMFRRASITVGTRAWLAGSASKHPLTMFSILRRAKSSLASAAR